MKTRTIPFRFTDGKNDKHLEYIRACEVCTFNIAEGAIRAGKTIDNIFAFAHCLEKSRDRIHLATGSTSANAKLNIGDANGFGLEWIYRGQCRWGKYQGNECLFVKGPATRGMQKIIIFAGGGKADSYKKIRGNSYGMWIATEINLHHDNTIKEAFNRTAAAKDRKFFWDLNPDNPNADIYTQYIDLYRRKQEEGELLGGCNYAHFVLDDNPNITEERKAEIKSQYDVGSLWYRRDIEGIRCAAEGLIYDMFDENRHIVDTSLIPMIGSRYISCDYGTQNATVFKEWQKGEDGIWYNLKEYYYSGRDERKQKTDAEYVADMDDFIGEDKVRAIIVDPSAASFITALRKDGHSVIKADNDVANGIREVSSFLRRGLIKYDRSCVNTFKEYRSYIWDSKAAAKGVDAPVKENDHAMDADRYFIKTIAANKTARILDKRKRGFR